VVIVDMGVAAKMDSHPQLLDRKIAFGTANIAKGAAMTREQAEQSILRGVEIVEAEIARGLDILATGDMGIGNTTPSAAIACVVTGKSAREIVGRGTGVDDDGLRRKISAVENALKVNQPNPNDGLDILSKVGGFEIGGLAGAILGAAANHRPVVIDGFISTAAAIIAATIAPQVKDYLIAAHTSRELGHRLMMEWLGVTPLLDMQMRLGEGTGAALAMSIVEASCKILDEMATFGEAGVSEKA
jgi:nicotinate-nucleotide--dimethylbenzimidazole phosphoribosyltransferase